MNIFDFDRKKQTCLLFKFGRKGVKIRPKLFFVRMFTYTEIKSTENRCEIVAISLYVNGPLSHKFFLLI